MHLRQVLVDQAYLLAHLPPQSLECRVELVAASLQVPTLDSIVDRSLLEPLVEVLLPVDRLDLRVLEFAEPLRDARTLHEVAHADGVGVLAIEPTVGRVHDLP